MAVETRGSASFQDEALRDVARQAQLLEANVASVILGKGDVVRACVVALLAGGHLVIEDYPGVGKTLLAKALARSVACRFARVQFTPDLLPSDVTGVGVFNQKTGEFEFRPGPDLRQHRRSPTRSTAPRQRRRPACSNAWKSGRRRSTTRPTRSGRRSW